MNPRIASAIFLVLQRTRHTLASVRPVGTRLPVSSKTPASKTARDRTVAYVCEGPQCSEPIDDLPRLVRYMRDGILTRPR